MELPEGQEQYKMKLITRDCCFFCLKTDNIRQSDEDENFSSMGYLLRHLKINLSGFSSSKEGHKILASLCESCEKTNARFSKLSQNLKKIQLELNYVLGSIHSVVADSAKDVALVENYSKRMTSDVEALSQLAVVDKLRKDLANKCMEKQVGLIPCIKLNLSKVEQNVEPIKEEMMNDCNLEDNICEDQSDTFLDLPSQSHLFPEQANTKTEVDPLPIKNSHKRKIKKHLPTSTFGFKDPSTGYLHCKKCDKSYQYIASIRRHYESFHLKKRFKCDICNVSVHRLSYLKEHRKTCRETLAIEKERDNLQFACDECGKRFKTKSNLSVHRASVHKNIDRYLCNLCDKKFKRSEHLKTHFESVHLGKRFDCGFCSKNFAYKRVLQRHERKCPMKTNIKEEHMERVCGVNGE